MSQEDSKEIKGAPGWIPRITIVITAEQFFDLKKYIPYGMKSPIYQKITADLIKVLKSPIREKILGAFANNMLDLTHISEEIINATESDKE